MSSWDDLRYLLALKQHGTLAKAATSLKTNPTTVSRHIKRLSDAQEETLVHMRRGGEWSLTDLGERFVSVATSIQDSLNELENVAPSPTRVKVSTLEFIASSFITPNLSRWRTMQPGIDLEIECKDTNVSLAYGEADIALRLGRPKSGRLIVSKLTDIEMNIFSIGGQTRSDWIGFSSEHDALPEMVMAAEFFGRPPIVRAESYACIRRMAVDMNLAAIGPAFMFEGFNGLTKIEGGGAGCFRELWSLYHERRKHDQRLAAVRRWLKLCVEQQTLKAVA